MAGSVPSQFQRSLGCPRFRLSKKGLGRTKSGSPQLNYARAGKMIDGAIRIGLDLLDLHYGFDERNGFPRRA